MHSQRYNSTTLRLRRDLSAIFDKDYPRFSDFEYERRHAGLALAMQSADVDYLLIVTSSFAGNAPAWTVNLPNAAEAFLVFKQDEPMMLFVEYPNYVPLVRKIVIPGVNVCWGEQIGLVKATEELKRRGAKSVGVIGPLPGPKWMALADHFKVVSLDAEYIKLRLIKSDEEIEWMRIGAALSDAGFSALLAQTEPGMTEYELANTIERAYVGQGGTTGIHFVGVTSMSNPDVFVPRQWPSRRRVSAGDIVFCEITSSWWDYRGQVLRSFTVEADPSPIYSKLYETAKAAYDAITKSLRPGATPQQLIDASGVIEDAGFTICDDLVHGYGGGYLPPILGTRSRPAAPVQPMTFAENMTLVVQPNVMTRDQTAGVQLGDLVRVTATGFESLQCTPHGFFRAGHVL